MSFSYRPQLNKINMFIIQMRGKTIRRLINLFFYNKRLYKTVLTFDIKDSTFCVFIFWNIYKRSNISSVSPKQTGNVKAQNKPSPLGERDAGGLNNNQTVDKLLHHTHNHNQMRQELTAHFSKSQTMFPKLPSNTP